MEPVIRFFHAIKEYLSIRIFAFGSSEITVWTILYVLGILVLILWVSGRVRHFVVHRLLDKSTTDIGVRQAIGTIVRYVIVVFGLVVIVQTAGVDLSSLTIVAGALGIGIGLGLQNITNNFISGIIILFERPIKVGDRIQVAGITGDVVRISARATTVVTNDNISIIIPNADFITNSVTNWSHSDRNVRIHVPVGVSYASDVDKVKKVLLDVATGHPGVLKEPAADVLFEEFGDSSLNFDLRVWSSEYITHPYMLRSELNFSIRKKFKEEGIEVPFPQRDIHVRSGVLNAPPTESSSDAK
jgi:small-conductance mechanosensitive channel